MVTKTATVSLHNNTYQGDPGLVGRKVELVFSPFDLETIEVRYQDKSYGKALPHIISRHVHPKAKPETPDPAPATPTGIDYMALTAAEHHELIRGDQRIGFDALYGNTPTDPPTEPAATEDSTYPGQIPGQLGIDDIHDTPAGAGVDADNQENCA